MTENSQIELLPIGDIETAFLRKVMTGAVKFWNTSIISFVIIQQAKTAVITLADRKGKLLL